MTLKDSKRNTKVASSDPDPESERPSSLPSSWQMVARELMNIAYDIRMFHWSTDEYHAHKISGKLYKKMSDMIDSVVELLIGQGGYVANSGSEMNGDRRSYPNILKKKNEFERVRPVDRPSMVTYLSHIVDIIESKDNVIGKTLSSNPALSSIRDEMSKEFRVSAYLMRMK